MLADFLSALWCLCGSNFPSARRKTVAFCLAAIFVIRENPGHLWMFLDPQIAQISADFGAADGCKEERKRTLIFTDLR